jgi:hypothetical protein
MEEKYEKLKELIRLLLDEVSNYSNGCGCCASMSVREHGEFKQIEEILNELILC